MGKFYQFKHKFSGAQKITTQNELVSYWKGGTRTWTSALRGLVLAGGWWGISGQWRSGNGG